MSYDAKLKAAKAMLGRHYLLGNSTYKPSDESFLTRRQKNKNIKPKTAERRTPHAVP